MSKIGSITKVKPESCWVCWAAVILLTHCRKGAKALRSEYQVYCKTIALNQNNVKYAHLVLQNNNDSKTQNKIVGVLLSLCTDVSADNPVARADWPAIMVEVLVCAPTSVSTAIVT